MAGRKLPAVRLQSLPAEDTEGLSKDPVVVELPPSNKFGFAWPDSSPSSDQPLSLLPSDAETDSSEAESFAPAQDGAEESDYVTPTNNMEDINPLDDVSLPVPAPRAALSRAFSMPTPSQLRHLRNPRRLVPTPDGEWNTIPVELSPEYAQFHELSLELADSVQATIQMLLQLSPSQLLDPAKEQLSGCSISIPTPSMAAMFTVMKNLNYMSANMSGFCTEPMNAPRTVCTQANPSSLPVPGLSETHFDIGEMLQSVGDSLSGLAAHAGVDLVLFHQDVGMKHVVVNGDESGLSYTISYIVRQIIGTAWRGDSVEIGLFIESPPVDALETKDLSFPLTDADLAPPRRLRCTFYIAHRFSASELSYRPFSAPPSPTSASSILDPDTASSRPLPSFKTIILRRLLRQIGADFTPNVPPDAFSEGRACELVIVLDQGSISEQSSTSDSCTYSNVEIASEPSLQDLAQFLESLRGKRVTLCATSRGSFAHHLSSYLTAWGLDVSHLSIDPQYLTNGSGVSREGTPAPEAFTFPSGNTIPVTPSNDSSMSPSFLLIDDNVTVLKNHLERLRLETITQMSVHSRRRPTLSHRPKSTPHIGRGTGSSSFSWTPSYHQTVIIHFTSLANYKRVKETIQQVLSGTSMSSSQVPEVIVIPKPAGPRRVLTALFTATKKPVVDALFSPIATSPMTPMTPSIQASSSSFAPDEAPKSRHVSRPSGSQRTSSDRESKSPKDVMTEAGPLPSSPLAVSDSMEYFSEAAVKLGSSPSSGMVIQNPDGQPAGIFFLPGAKGGGTGLGLGIGPGNGGAIRSAVPSPTMERDKAQFGMTPRRTSEETKSTQNTIGYLPAIDSPRRSPRTPILTNLNDVSGSTDRPTGMSLPTNVTSQQDSLRGAQRTQSQTFDSMVQKVSSPPASPGARGTAARRGTNGRRIGAGDTKSPTPTVGSKKQKGTQDANIVPPISVLIVDDNPINQTILSTFMKKKKIKYDVAKNGEEAVQKWKSGVFHLILMDIQMPVMDGIQATKEIRRMEKFNGAVGFPSTPSGTPIDEGQTTPSDVASNDSRLASTPYRSSVIIVALTASSLQSDRVAALAAGCNDFLTKPVSLHWLNSKIIEWGSIKALQMWADIRPDVVKSFSSGQAAQAQKVARRLHVPEGRTTPSGTPTRSRSRSSSLTKPVVTNTSKWASSPKHSSLAESISPSPEAEVPSPETSLGVLPSVMAAPNPANRRNADIVSLDKEFFPPSDESPDGPCKADDVSDHGEETPPPDAGEQ